MARIEVGERAAGQLVKARGHEPPRLRIIGHVVVAEAIELPGAELRVDHLEHGDSRVSVLRRDEVAERAQRALLRRVEEPDRRDVLGAPQDDAARDLVPVTRLREHVVVRITAVHLRRHAAPLARQLLGRRRDPVGAPLGQMVGAAEIVRHRYQRSRRMTAASRPMAPTMASDPGASNGGPVTRL